MVNGKNINVGIIGAAGYTAGELLRILDAIRMFREIPAVTPDSA